MGIIRAQQRSFSLVPQKQATLSIPAALEASMSITRSPKEIAAFADTPTIQGLSTFEQDVV